MEIQSLRGTIPGMWCSLRRASGSGGKHNIVFLSFIGFQFKMAAGLKPGVPVILRELEPSSEMFKQGASLRVTGRYVKHPLTCTCEQPMLQPCFFEKSFTLLLRKQIFKGTDLGIPAHKQV